MNGTLEFWLHVLLSVVLISMFICIFFFTYASTVERQIVVKQTKDLVNDLSQDIVQIPIISQNLKPYVESWKLPDSSSQDKKVDDANNLLIKKAYTIVFTFAIVILTIVVILAYLYEISFFHLFIPNLIILVFVGLTEFLFLQCIARNYVSFDPNYAEYKIIGSLREFANTKND